MVLIKLVLANICEKDLKSDNEIRKVVLSEFVVSLCQLGARSLSVTETVGGVVGVVMGLVTVLVWSIAEFGLRIKNVAEDRHQYLRYEGLQYTDADIVDFETRLTRIYRREVHRVHVFNFGGLADLMAKGLSARMLMEHKDAQRESLFTSQAWRRLFDIRGPLLELYSFS
ncbi:hypothetical protein Tco_0714525 [Tanacetum coccineum]